MPDTSRIDFYESLVSDLKDRYKTFYKDLKGLMGERPFGWVKMSNVQKLAWLEQITQDDPRVMDLYAQVGFDRLMSLFEERDRLESRYGAQETGPESIAGKASRDRSAEFLRRYIDSTMFPKSMPVSQLEQFRQLLNEMEQGSGYRQRRAQQNIEQLREEI